MKIIFNIMILSLIMAAPAWANPSDDPNRFFWARVVHVADGDTIEVVKQGDKLKMLKVRLYGVDAPEDGQAYGKKIFKHLYPK
jgi:Micrococcal nuclease (thermonuclease) homologs